MRSLRPGSRVLSVFAAVLAVALLVPLPAASAKDYASDVRPGIDEKLGETIPLDIEFNDEDGNPVSLETLIQRPTILTLVYFRCPAICSPLMHEVAATVDKIDLVPGIDFDLITVSFDAEETPELARTAKDGLLKKMKRKLPPESWRFLTGDPLAITKLADAVGFRFRREDKDFEHAGTVIFLTKEGMIVRYLGGLSLLPLDVKMALIDAAEGNPRSFFQRIQSLCYAYDPEGKTYVFQVNRIVLFVTLIIVGAFFLFLVVKRRRPESAPEPEPESEDPGTERTA